MKERPILFSAPMVRAILDGRKTQTRRTVKHGALGANGPCPYGAPGDRLWVKEAHQIFQTWTSAVVIYREDGSQSEQKDQHAMGPGIHINMGNPLSEYTSFNERFPERWRPSIHMPRAASRLTLEVTAVRVERVQDISETDAIAEGITSVRGPQFDKRHWPDYVALRDATPAGDTPPLGPKPSQVFKALWDDINGAESWDANPWVWVVSFRRVEP